MLLHSVYVLPCVCVADHKPYSKKPNRIESHFKRVGELKVAPGDKWIKRILI